MAMRMFAQPKIVEPGFCACGCGERTRLEKFQGKIQPVGQPRRYKHGHNKASRYVKEEPKLCECGCGEHTEVETRNDELVPAGYYRKWRVGHQKKKNYSGKVQYQASPYIPDAVVYLSGGFKRYPNKPRRWQCRCYFPGGRASAGSHARAVYMYHFGAIPDGFQVHHKNGRAITIEDDAPSNLMLLPRRWNERYFPVLSEGLGVSQEQITRAYCKFYYEGVEESLLFRSICEELLKGED